MKYYWVRIYDYKVDDELKEFTDDNVWDSQKGTLLDEYYLYGEDMSRSEAKDEVKKKSSISRFAKPRKGSGIYALVMESNQFFYERFNIEVDTICFNCHKSIKGKQKDFPYITTDGGEKYYFCSYGCRAEISRKINPYYEGEFQTR